MSREYTGNSAENYTQTPDKTHVLFPVLRRLLEEHIDGTQDTGTSRASLLDLGCGRGDLYPLVHGLGYDYFGVDNSEEMLALARKAYPDPDYLLADVTAAPPIVLGKFDVVLSVMVLSCIGSVPQFDNAFRFAAANLKPAGVLIIATIHPGFDGYMQKGLIGRDYIETEFKGYFSAGTPYAVHRELNGRSFTFHDHHWTLSDYYNGYRSAVMSITQIDECGREQTKAGDLVNQVYPIFLVLKGRDRSVAG